MAMLGSALMGGLMSHSDAEKMFRPWWDAIEDFVIYGLIMLGLIVSPTTIFNGTPLYCTLCTQPGQCGSAPNTTTDPGYHIYFVKSYCTHKALGKFTLYFPYILLISALILVGIERLFKKIFKTNIQVEGFYSLLLTSKKIDGVDGEDMNMEDTVHTVEVRQSFKHNSSFFPSYFIRTIFEFFFGLLLTLYMLFTGVSELINWNSLDLQDIDIDELVDLKKDNVRVFCDVHGVFYECSGVPTQFYLYVLLIALILLIIYLFTTFLTILWLLCPCGGKLARFMRSYRSQLESAAIAQGADTSSRVLLGEIHDIYYENRDLRLLLDLLSVTSGLAPPLRVLALLDKQFRKQCKPDIISLERDSQMVNGESDITLEFSESSMARNIFSQMSALSCLYTVQILPRTDKDSMEVFVFEKEVDRIFSGLSIFSMSSEKGVSNKTNIPRKKFLFHGADADTTYTVKVTLVLNGKAIATAQKKIKALPQDQWQKDQKQNLLVSQLNIQSMINRVG
eukprot:TRINITY_DN38342_c0_g1_i1.p1 TRINITY_DN38342_c0_g1~~TRINITY_DN38342_c0_g1_i1.p1  ORF type:complete len:507 (+),score=138.46 TRINITY_DN38342_c0_g1_i1:23-1543(+)